MVTSNQKGPPPPYYAGVQQQQWQPPLPPPPPQQQPRQQVLGAAVNRDGAPVHRGQGGRYYCGRRGLYTCGQCDGQCGPTNGCNCPACAALDLAAGIAPFHGRNRDGVPVRIGEGGRHFCGRYGLYTCARGCDGQCGPTNGCCCAACAEMDRAAGLGPWHPPTAVPVPGPRRNRDGAIIQIGQGGHHYCGRRGLYVCPRGCDGQCGPTNGCCCQACGELDRAAGLGPWHGGIEVPGGPRRNRDGVAVHIGLGGHHYCGRRGLYTCGECDGQCGPTNGCNCPACAALDLAAGVAPFHGRNRDGVAVHIGVGGRHYCGRYGLYRCPRGCDGQCGPTNGCNCAACAAMDTARGVRPYH
jgi:hypothetical protein